jgi:hypothetical protein
MKRLANFCWVVSWPVVVRTLIAAALLEQTELFARPEGDAPAVSGRLMLGGKNPAHQGRGGLSLREEVAIADLPKQVIFKQGDVSLVADPKDAKGEYMTIYLVNDTDLPISTFIPELKNPISQVKVADHWFSDEETGERSCGGPVSIPKDMPAKSALALGAWYCTKGDTEGKRRFVLYLKNQVIFSEPIRGVCRMADLQGILDDESSPFLTFDMQDRLFLKQWGGVGCARSSEEFVAMLELIRNQGMVISQRRNLLDWIGGQKSKTNISPELARAINGMANVLEKPWLVYNDPQKLINRSLIALGGKKSDQYGTPEKCRSMVWRYLSDSRLDSGIRYAGPASEALDSNSLVALADLADKVMMESADSDEIEGAGMFLASPWLSERHFSADRFRQYLKSGRCAVVRAGLAGLTFRGRSDESGRWLSEHYVELGHDLAACYLAAASNRPMEDWEYPIIDLLLDSDPSEALSLFDSRFSPLAKDRIPGSWVVSLRRFLRSELTEEREDWWVRRNGQTKDDPDHGATDKDMESFVNGIHLLARWGDASDIPLFQKLLEHPASRFQKTGRGFGTLVFPIRQAAKEVLVLLHEKVPSALVTEKFIITADQKPATLKFLASPAWGWLGIFVGAGLMSLYWIFRSRHRVSSEPGSI